MAGTKISVRISRATRDQVERYAAAHGLKKSALMEQALLHHLRGLKELPKDVAPPAYPDRVAPRAGRKTKRRCAA